MALKAPRDSTTPSPWAGTSAPPTASPAHQREPDQVPTPTNTKSCLRACAPPHCPGRFSLSLSLMAIRIDCRQVAGVIRSTFRFRDDVVHLVGIAYSARRLALSASTNPAIALQHHQAQPAPSSAIPTLSRGSSPATAPRRSQVLMRFAVSVAIAVQLSAALYTAWSLGTFSHCCPSAWSCP